ncbi:hypothetical protein PVK06_021632 [Gossypium arboreum]|uniref:Uncharacterized protein n=2 Tax=Gossypium TaxID=3633 RepID=A0ABR0PR24_GOSAR|nr:hypothetical protein PVK06_021632 [Gossypium arboreum]
MAGERALFKFLKPGQRLQPADVQAAAMWGVAATTGALWLIQVNLLASSQYASASFWLSMVDSLKTYSKVPMWVVVHESSRVGLINPINTKWLLKFGVTRNMNQLINSFDWLGLKRAFDPTNKLNHVELLPNENGRSTKRSDLEPLMQER